jgi:restriction system protein
MTAQTRWQQAHFSRRFPRDDNLVPGARWPLRRWARRLRAAAPPSRTWRRLTASQWRGWFTLFGFSSALLAWLVYRSVIRPAWPLLLPGWMLEILEVAEVAGVVTMTILWAFLTWRTWTSQGGESRASDLYVRTLEEMYALSPADFEAYVADLFRRKGHRVTLRGRSGDLGVDLEIVDDRGRRAIVQCKRYQNTIGAEVIRELYGTFMHEKAVHAYLVTTADISEAAREWARGKPLTLIDGRLLEDIAHSLASA